MKRHHEDNHYSSGDVNGGGAGSTTPSARKRMATRTNSQSNSTTNVNINGNYSPPTSTESDSSSSTVTTNSQLRSHVIDTQLCICPKEDCVIHDNRHSTNVPQELSTSSNPIYGNKNLLLYYAHLERCRRYGQNIHQSTSSS